MTPQRWFVMVQFVGAAWRRAPMPALGWVYSLPLFLTRVTPTPAHIAQ
jgi:hypothetical protein